MSADKGNDQTFNVTPKMLRRLAGDRYFGRGEAYFAEGAVQSLRRDGGSVKAVVQGTQRYRVHLWAEDGGLGHDCSCPLGRDGEFCKHCVAVGLALHRGDRTEDDGKAFGEADLRAYLLGRNKEDLVSMLCDWAEKDERLHRDLMVRAAQATEGTASLSVWKDALDGALETGDFVHYREAYDYASGVEDVIENLEDLLQSGKADSVIELAEFGLEAVEECIEYIDDSDGWMSGHLYRLQELHLEACRKARPDPVALAERLFEGEMESSFDSYHGAALVYKEVLGEAGLAAYRRLAEADWTKVPALDPGEEDANRHGSRTRITAIMEALAKAEEDFDALVAVKSHDLSLPYAFLKIAELYEGEGDPDLALEWAERGWRAFPDRRRDERLRAFIVKAYQSRGRGGEAMTLEWEAFVERPGLDTYRQLERQARRVKAWPDWRDKALAEIRKYIAGKKTEQSAGHRSWMASPSRDHSLLVEIFLYE